MSFAPIQQEVDEWISQFAEGYFPPLAMLLARAVAHRYGGKKAKSGEAEGDIGEEIADAIFVLVCTANSLDKEAVTP